MSDDKEDDKVEFNVNDYSTYSSYDLEMLKRDWDEKERESRRAKYGDDESSHSISSTSEPSKNTPAISPIQAFAIFGWVSFLIMLYLLLK